MIRNMAYDERLDPNSGFYRGVRVAILSICKFLRDNEAPDAADMLKQRFTPTKFLAAYRERSPQYRRKKLKASLKVIRGGVDGN